MARLVWSNRSQNELRQIVEFIRNDSQLAAAAIMTRILATVARLREFPDSGRRLPELSEMTFREVIVRPYRIIYKHTADDDVVGIVTVRHGARRLAREDLAKDD